MADSRHCNEYNQLLSAYLDGDLNPSERTDLLQHLAGCASCRRQMEEYRNIGTRLRGLPPVIVPEALTAAVYLHTVDAPPRRLRHVTNRMAYPAAAIAAVFMVFIVAAFLLVDGYQRRIEPTVLGSTPTDGVMWRTSDPIRITFNKEMNQPSVEAALVILPTSERERLAFAWDGNTLIIGQNRLLKPGTTYSIRITTEARDKWDNRLTENFSLGFTTSMDVATSDATPTPVPSPTAVQEQQSPTATPRTNDSVPSATQVPKQGQSEQSTAPTATPRPQSNDPVPPQQQQQQNPPAATEPPGGPPAQEPTVAQSTPPPAPPAATQVPGQSPVDDPTAPSDEPREIVEPEQTATAIPEQPTNPTVAPTATSTPEATPTPDTVAVTGSFGNVYWRNESVRDQLGDPQAAARDVSVQELDFQRGKMLQNLANGQVILMDVNSRWEFVFDSSSGEPLAFAEVEGSGLWEPGGVFGHIWHADPYVADVLGLAVAGGNHAYSSMIQNFNGGQMLYSADGYIYILYNNGTWELYPDAGPLADDTEP